MASNLTVWDNFYGFNFTPLKNLVEEKNRNQPAILEISEKSLIANHQEMIKLDLKSTQPEDLVSLKQTLTLKIIKAKF